MDIEGKEVEIVVRVRLRTVKWKCPWSWHECRPREERMARPMFDDQTTHRPEMTLGDRSLLITLSVARRA